MFDTTLPFINTYIELLEEGIKNYRPHYKLSNCQKKWLKYCLMGIVLSNTVCWKKFERMGLGDYKSGALSWMFLKTKLPWEWIFTMSVSLVLIKLGITEGILVADDTDHKRAKVTTKIFGTHKVYDKKTGGYFNGQTVVLLLLVTPLITLPVGFRFYCPDPAQKAWKKEDKKLTKKGIKKSNRPEQPVSNPKYPTQTQLVLDMLNAFRKNHSQIKVQAILADALYGNASFMDKAAQLYKSHQVISQLHCDQKIFYRNREMQVSEYFAKYSSSSFTIQIRGGKKMIVRVNSARLWVTAQGCKRFVIALKYEGETKYRYLVATEMSWRTLDIVQAYTARWLVEVFFEDWKLYEGWGQMAKQPGEEGSSRSLILSLLCDHAFLLHPKQITRLENKMPVYTVGSLRDLSRSEAFLELISNLIKAENPGDKLVELANRVKELFPLRLSSKHMSGKTLGRLESTPSLVYHVAEIGVH